MVAKIGGVVNILYVLWGEHIILYGGMQKKCIFFY